MTSVRVVAALCLVLATAPALAAETVVFVHGLAGWGPDEMGPLNYWAELDEFEKKGFNVFEASVGPVSSNWDRACELYAQIKGTQVDYGAAHAALHSHDRMGKDYTGKGFMPTWGPDNRIHFVGHSMGGQTIRMLEVLLQKGDQAEIDAGATSPLFTKSGNWIKSITTYSTPHDGTPIVDILGEQLVDFIKDLILSLAGVTGDTLVDLLYDFDLDHFNLKRGPGESYNDYFDRVMSSSIWDTSFKDFAPHDLSVAGSYELQQRGDQVYDGTYYFAYATERTMPFWGCQSWKCGWLQVPEPAMWLPLHFTANLIGSLSQDSAQRSNDGLVPLESAKCPKIAYGGVGCVEYDGIWREGVWNWQVFNRDHIQAIGFTLLWPVANSYKTHADRVLTISADGYSSSSLVAGIDNGAAEPAAPPQDAQDSAGMITVSATSAVAFGALGTAGIVAGVAAFVVELRRRRRGSSASRTSAAAIAAAPEMAAKNPRYLGQGAV